MITQTFDLNLIPNSAPVVVHVNQYDIGEGRLVATLYNGDQLYTPTSGATALIEGTKPDNKGYSYPATISGSTVTADLQLQMSCVAGKSRVNIIIQEGDNKTGTFVFYLDVQATGLSDDADISESDIAPYIDAAQAAARSAAASAAEAEQYAQGGLHFKSSVTFANIPTTGMKTGDMYNITNDFTTDSRFEEGAGVSVKAGTNIAWNTNSKWDLLATGGSGSGGVGKTMESGATVTFAQVWGQDQAKIDFPVDSTATISDHAEIFNDYRTRDNSGNGNLAIGKESHAEGNCALAYGNYTHVEGENNVANGAHAHAEGSSTYAKGANSHSEGLKTLASGDDAHAEGSSTCASGINSHAEGYNTLASSDGAHAEGHTTTASGTNSHAEGFTTIASGNLSHAEGGRTTASNYEAHAEGYYTTASGQYSHAEGYNTTAGYSAQHASGQFNNNKSDTYFEVGNGTADNARSNAFEVTSDGYIRTHNNNVKIAFGVDANGNYGYIKEGDNTVYPFNSNSPELTVYIVGGSSSAYMVFDYNLLYNTFGYTAIYVEDRTASYLSIYMLTSPYDALGTGASSSFDGKKTFAQLGLDGTKRYFVINVPSGHVKVTFIKD